MKVIKFDLPINGIKVKTLDELRDNLTDELVSLARSGQLVRWLKSRQLSEVAQSVEAGLASASSDAALFMSVCASLDVVVHPADVECLFAPAPPAGKTLLPAEAQLTPHLQKNIELAEKFSEVNVPTIDPMLIKSSKRGIDFEIRFKTGAIRTTANIWGTCKTKKIRFFARNGDRMPKGALIAIIGWSDIIWCHEVEIFAPSYCMIKNIKFKDGDVVKYGDVIASATEIN